MFAQTSIPAAAALHQYEPTGGPAHLLSCVNLNSVAQFCRPLQLNVSLAPQLAALATIATRALVHCRATCQTRKVPMPTRYSAGAFRISTLRQTEPAMLRPALVQHTHRKIAYQFRHSTVLAKSYNIPRFSEFKTSVLAALDHLRWACRHAVVLTRPNKPYGQALLCCKFLSTIARCQHSRDKLHRLRSLCHGAYHV